MDEYDEEEYDSERDDNMEETAAMKLKNKAQNDNHAFDDQKDEYKIAEGYTYFIEPVSKLLLANSPEMYDDLKELLVQFILYCGSEDTIKGVYKAGMLSSIDWNY